MQYTIKENLAIQRQSSFIANAWGPIQWAASAAARRRKRIAQVKSRTRFLQQKPKLTFKAQRIKVDISKEDLGRIRDILKRPNLTRKHIAGLVGALPGATISEIHISKFGYIQIHIEHPSYEADRVLFKDHIKDEIFDAYDHRTGIGISSFSQQVNHAAKHGFKYIETHAAGRKGSSENGYYTWPRFGYDGKINEIQRDRLARILKTDSSKINRLSDLMKTKEGREAWKKEGTGTDMTFDLTKGSTSRKVLAAYVREKRKQTTTY